MTCQHSLSRNGTVLINAAATDMQRRKFKSNRYRTARTVCCLHGGRTGSMGETDSCERSEGVQELQAHRRCDRGAATVLRALTIRHDGKSEVYQGQRTPLVVL